MGRLIIPLIILLLTSCSNDIRQVMSFQKQAIVPSQVGDSVTLLYSDSTRLKVMMKANKMLVYDRNVTEPFTLLPNGVYVTFFDQDEKVSATLRANYGVRYGVNKFMEARYKVVVVNVNGEKLETERLIWDERTHKIHTESHVKITRGNEVIMGEGLVSNQDLTQYEITHVTGQFRVATESQE